ncbi:MAG: DNA alkylation repair protein [Synergistaceae bacterium]|nr:DNA alkylation repair protein [Synergistaceae bacterium]
MDSLTSQVLKKLFAVAASGGSKGKMPDGKLDLFGLDKLVFLDVPHDKLMEIAHEVGIPRHELALDLWNEDSYEAKLLSCIFSEPSEITEEQADEMARGLDSWVICKFCCSKLLWKLPFAPQKAVQWANSPDDKISCLGFTLIAALAAKMPGGEGENFGFFDNALFQARKGASRDDLDVRRAITSALSMIGRRSRDWLDAAIETADEIGAQPCEASRWVASQSLAELKSTKITKKINGLAD